MKKVILGQIMGPPVSPSVESMCRVSPCRRAQGKVGHAVTKQPLRETMGVVGWGGRGRRPRLRTGDSAWISPSWLEVSWGEAGGGSLGLIPYVGSPEQRLLQILLPERAHSPGVASHPAPHPGQRRGGCGGGRAEEPVPCPLRV